MKRRCTKIHDYTSKRALRCSLEPGHEGICKPLGWERLTGSTLVLVETIKRRPLPPRKQAQS